MDVSGLPAELLRRVFASVVHMMPDARERYLLLRGAPECLTRGLTFAKLGGGGGGLRGWSPQRPREYSEYFRGSVAVRAVLTLRHPGGGYRLERLVGAEVPAAVVYFTYGHSRNGLDLVEAVWPW